MKPEDLLRWLARRDAARLDKIKERRDLRRLSEGMQRMRTDPNERRRIERIADLADESDVVEATSEREQAPAVGAGGGPATSGPRTVSGRGVGTITQGRSVAEIADKELLAGQARGDARAFAELVHRHRDRMWEVALRTIGDPEEAADVLQDAFLSAYRAAGRFPGDAAVATWLHRIVVNACLDRIRRRSIRPAVPVGDDATLDSVAPKKIDPTALHEVSLDVREALAQLPFEQRAALVLVDMMGYSVEEAAKVLEMPAGTIKSRCARGRARLAPLLRDLRDRRNR